jgi:prepilin-type N-terminal cleavage/methylation domain-containing protein
VLKRIRATREDGFTLTELLIVIVVLGILAGIVVFAINTFTSDSRLTACKADKRTVEIAAEAYKAKVGSYPTTFTELTTGGAYLKSQPTNEDYDIVLEANGVVKAYKHGSTTVPYDAKC